MRGLLILLNLMVSACAGSNLFVDEPAEELTSESRPIKPAAPLPVPLPRSGSDMELRLAKLWTRVDDLENQQIRQKERMKLLEKGLMLGIVPDEIKGEKSSRQGTEKKLEPEQGELPASLQAVPPTPTPAPAVSEKSKDIAEYRRIIEAAQQQFNAANYGQAIVQFNEIGEKFDDSISEGSHHYWVGLSWFYLKEYHLAELSFRKLVEHHNHNSWVPYARFYLAKIDQNRGLSGRARDQFKLLIDEYPNQDLGEMARMEIDRMREKL